MKTPITIYKDAVVGRLENRRVIITKNEVEGVNIRFDRICNDSHPAAYHEYTKRRLTTAISLTDEMSKLLIECLAHHHKLVK